MGLEFHGHEVSTVNSLGFRKLRQGREMCTCLTELYRRRLF